MDRVEKGMGKRGNGDWRRDKEREVTRTRGIQGEKRKGR